MDMFYLIFMLERVIVCSLIAYLPSPTFCSAGIIAIYFILLAILFISYRKLSCNSDEAKKIGILSHISGNYILRQGFNFLSVIAIQFVIMSSQIAMRNPDESGVNFTTNNDISKLIPMLILCLILMNLVFNIFFWVWELKVSQIILKTKIIAGNFLCK
jgi:hypothetical protein